MNPSGQAQDPISEIFQQRAQALAHRIEPIEAPGSTLEIVEFKLAHERYGIESAFVREIIPLEDMTPLPCTPAYVRGLIKLRGLILPVIDLKRFLGLPEGGIADLHRVLIVESPDMEFGLLADTVVGIRQMTPRDLQPPPSTLSVSQAGYLRGVTAEMLVILDGARLVSDPRLVVHEEVEN